MGAVSMRRRPGPGSVREMTEDLSSRGVQAKAFTVPTWPTLPLPLRRGDVLARAALRRVAAHRVLNCLFVCFWFLRQCETCAVRRRGARRGCRERFGAGAGRQRYRCSLYVCGTDANYISTLSRKCRSNKTLRIPAQEVMAESQ